MGWESSDVVRFDLEPLPQGQMRTVKFKSAYNLLIIMRPSRDACLYMGEATPPDPHFLFVLASQP